MNPKIHESPFEIDFASGFEIALQSGILPSPAQNERIDSLLAAHGRKGAFAFCADE